MQVERPKVWRVWVPAGKYVLGDPCYAVSSAPREDSRVDLWAEGGESCDWFESSPVAKVMVKGTEYRYLGFPTAWGDGTYTGSDGFSYPVDAGLIGLVPVEIADTDRTDVSMPINRVVEFTTDTLCTCNDGVLMFGNITINTRDWDGEED